MAQIKDVKLTFENSTDPTKKRAKVDFKLVFSEAEAGKKYRYDIKLLSEDLLGDEEGAHPSKVLADFSFFLVEERTIVAQQGEQSRSHAKVVSKSTLNEDSGTHGVTDPSTGQTHQIANWDDIFAQVSLHPEGIGVTLKERSPTKQLLLAS